MRRVLNRALYSPGIVAGLEVEPDKSDAHRVIVRDGLAFDHLGREIFLPADMSVLVSGVPSSTPGVVFGNLLAVSYRETRTMPVSTGCTASAPAHPCGPQMAWGAPTRIVAAAVFEVLDAWPAADSGKVVLAQIELSKTCEVVRCLPAVRKYAVPVKAGKTRVLSLSGDGDVAPDCPKVLHFHVADGLPERAQLYLRGSRFSSLWYTELAKHDHTLTIDVAGNSWTIPLDHEHALEGTTELDGEHGHTFWASKDGEKNEGGFKVAEDEFDSDNADKIEADDPTPLLHSKKHSHELTNVTVGDSSRTAYTITPDFTSSKLGMTGMEPGVRSGQRAYEFFKALTVKLDGTPVTAKILEQLPTLAQLGVGNSGTPESEPFVTEGTGAIDLLLLGVDLLPGAHTLEFISSAGGGKLYYELYLD